MLDKCQKATAKAVSKGRDTVLQYVHVKKGFIEASDAYIYVQKVVPYLGKDMLFEADDINKNNLSCEVVGQYTYPSADLFEQYFAKNKPVFSIALNRELLKKLISALGNDTNPVRFHFYGKDKPVRVEIPEEKTKGIIMPVLTKWED